MSTLRRLLRAGATSTFVLLFVYAAVGALVVALGIVLLTFDAFDTASGGPARRAHSQAGSDIAMHFKVLEEDFPPCARHFSAERSIIACMEVRKDDSSRPGGN